MRRALSAGWKANKGAAGVDNHERWAMLKRIPERATGRASKRSYWKVGYQPQSGAPKVEIPKAGREGNATSLAYSHSRWIRLIQQALHQALQPVV